MKKILIIIAFLIVVSGCEKKEEKVFEPDEEVTVDKEVETSYVFTKDSGILVTVTNPINEIVDLEVTITYYNEDEEEFAEDTVTLKAVHNLNPAYTHFKNIPDESTSFVVTSSYSISNVSHSSANILDVILDEDGHKVTGIINNFEDIDIDNISLGIIFYNDGEIVAYNDVYVDGVSAKGSTSFTSPYPLDISGNTILFDYTNFVVNNAYNE